jgi:hypothetical protein
VTGFSEFPSTVRVALSSGRGESDAPSPLATARSSMQPIDGWLDGSDAEMHAWLAAT